MPTNKRPTPGNIAGLKAANPDFFKRLKDQGYSHGTQVFYYRDLAGPSSFVISRPAEKPPYQGAKNGREYIGAIAQWRSLLSTQIRIELVLGRDGKEWWSRDKKRAELEAKIAVGDTSYGFKHLQGLPKGTDLWTQLNRVSSSGMSRAINVMHFACVDGKVQRSMIRVMEMSQCAQSCDQERAWGADYRIGGCGMDMGFALVYEMGQLVHGDGYWFNQRWL